MLRAWLPRVGSGCWAGLATSVLHTLGPLSWVHAAARHRPPEPWAGPPLSTSLRAASSGSLSVPVPVPQGPAWGRSWGGGLAAWARDPRRGCLPSCVWMSRVHVLLPGPSAWAWRAARAGSDARVSVSSPGAGQEGAAPAARRQPEHSCLLLPSGPPHRHAARGRRHLQDRAHLRPVPARESHDGRHGPRGQGGRPRVRSSAAHHPSGLPFEARVGPRGSPARRGEGRAAWVAVPGSPSLCPWGCAQAFMQCDFMPGTGLRWPRVSWTPCCRRVRVEVCRADSAHSGCRPAAGVHHVDSRVPRECGVPDPGVHVHVRGGCAGGPEWALWQHARVPTGPARPFPSRGGRLPCGPPWVVRIPIRRACSADAAAGSGCELHAQSPTRGHVSPGR